MAKTMAWVVGMVFVLLGILGFIPNPIVGMEGVFMTNAAHNIIHLVSGIYLIIAAMQSIRAAKMAFKVVGIVYLLVTILGFLTIGASGMGSLLGLVSMNAADNYFHLVLTAVFLALGFMGADTKTAAMPEAAV